MKIVQKPLPLFLLIATSISCSESPSSGYSESNPSSPFSSSQMSLLSFVIGSQPQTPTIDSRGSSPFGIVPATPDEDERDGASSGISSPASTPAYALVPGTPNTPHTPTNEQILARIEAELAQERAADQALAQTAAAAAAAMAALANHPYRTATNPFRTN